MEATKLLTKQHRKVEAIFRKLEGRGSGDKALLTELANDLTAHMAIEQELFYPAVQSSDRSLILESYEEHALAEVALKRLLATDPKLESFAARVTALKELIEHHVNEEEEELFPKVENELEQQQLRELGADMEARFEEIVKSGYESAVPRGFAKTSSDVSRKALKKSAPSKHKAA